MSQGKIEGPQLKKGDILEIAGGYFRVTGMHHDVMFNLRRISREEATRGISNDLHKNLAKTAATEKTQVKI